MSEKTPKITTVNKDKDPKRVEAGKRLAQLNKERKLQKEQQIQIEENVSNINYSLILNVIGVAVAVASLYYASRKPPSPPKIVEEKPLKVTALQMDSLE